MEKSLIPTEYCLTRLNFEILIKADFVLEKIRTFVKCESCIHRHEYKLTGKCEASFESDI